MAENTTPQDRDLLGEHVSEETRQADEAAARIEADAGRMPTPEEEQAAERNRVDPEVAKANKAFIEMGADVKGEGEIA